MARSARELFEEAMRLDPQERATRSRQFPGKSLERGCTGAEWRRPPSGSTLPQRRRRNRHMTGTPRETLLRRTASAKSSFPSAWYTDCAGTEWKSSPWRTVGVGQATGGRDSDPPSNIRMQRPALCAAADPARSADGN